MQPPSKNLRKELFVTTTEDDVDELWRNVVGHLTTDTRITPQLWGFLDLVEPRGVMGGVLYLEVPNELTRGMLEQRVRLPLLTAMESIEESGCELNQIKHLFSFYPSAGACDEIFHLYVAQAALPAEGGVFGMPDEGENIQLHIIDYSDLSLLLKSNRLKNAPVIMALQWLQQHLHAFEDV
jgi:hypothetical protein